MRKRALVVALALGALVGAACQSNSDRALDEAREYNPNNPANQEYTAWCTNATNHLPAVMTAVQQLTYMPNPPDETSLKRLAENPNLVGDADSDARVVLEYAPDEIKSELETLTETLLAVIDDPSETPDALADPDAGDDFKAMYDTVNEFYSGQCHVMEL